jgi:DNA-binding MurR/RpiR family transcriptional regulator
VDAKAARPKKLNDREWRAVRTLIDARELTIAEIASQYGVSPATIYRRLPSIHFIDRQHQAL